MNARQTRRPRRAREARKAGVALLAVLVLATFAIAAAPAVARPRRDTGGGRDADGDPGDGDRHARRPLSVRDGFRPR